MSKIPFKSRLAIGNLILFKNLNNFIMLREKSQQNAF